MRWLRAVLLTGLLVTTACATSDDGADTAATTTTAADADDATPSTTDARPETTTTTAAPAATTSTTVDVGSAAVTTTTMRGSSVTGAPDPGAPPPAFVSKITTVTARDLYATWRPGCPVPVDQLRAVDVSHWGFDGRIHTGRLVVAANEATRMAAVMGDLYAQRYPIQRMEPIDVFGGDDNRSMSANNTSAFNCRPVTGGGGWSEHAYGRAIDLNPLINPYVKGSLVLPPESAPYTDRTRNDPGMIHAGDGVVQSFLARGWKWGGYWVTLKDYQHFSTTGR
jgi:hypothetical protein